MSTTVAVGWTVLFPLERAPSPGLALGAALYFRLALSVVRRLARQKTEALPRVALATIMVAATTAAATHVALLPGTVSQSALTVTVATVALCSPLAAWWLAGQLPPRVVPRLGRTVSAIITTPSGATGTAELLQDLYPLTKLFPQGDLALVSLLDGSVGILQRTGEVTLHSAPLAEPLGDLLHRHASPLPMPARPVLGRAVRVPALRPLATVIEQVGARLIVPLPGGLEGGWAGALLIATPRRPTLWGELAPPLLRLARHLGPQLHASVALDQVSRRLGETEREQSRLQQESDRISRKLEGAQEENRLLRAARRQSQKIEIIGTSRAVQQLREELVEVASLPTSVTLVGEIGTGRALLARFVHDKSPQHHGPLVQFDCAANPPRMHRHALLCGATQDEVGLGLIELAHQGTLLLENVENLSTEAQDELNQVLATGEVCRPGPLSMRPVRLRVVATTGQQLDEGDLLPDLAARLATVTLSVPPLRARAEDIPELIQFFQERLAQRRGVVPGTWTEEALNELGRCSWPGNVRQLRAVVESAVFAANGGDVRREDLPPPLAPPPPRAAPRAAPPAPEAAAFDGTFHEIEERILHHVLAVTDGNKAEAARRLGLKRTTLASRLRKHGL
jgi:DNA-binding NtrC family response regulator